MMLRRAKQSPALCIPLSVDRGYSSHPVTELKLANLTTQHNIKPHVKTSKMASLSLAHSMLERLCNSFSLSPTGKWKFVVLDHVKRWTNLNITLCMKTCSPRQSHQTLTFHTFPTLCLTSSSSSVSSLFSSLLSSGLCLRCIFLYELFASCVLGTVSLV